MENSAVPVGSSTHPIYPGNIKNSKNNLDRRIIQMRKTLISLCITLTLCSLTFAQTNSTTTAAPANTTKQSAPRFSPTKDQIVQVQRILKVTETGKLSKDDRTALKLYQKANGLRGTGSLNRATVEKMGIALTEKQRSVPVSPNSFASGSDSGDKKRGPVFRATKEQIMMAQKMFKTNETGKLADADRIAIKAYQSQNGIKPTGGLNKATLEKMGIPLTDRQRTME
jgi:peptidoglycan hydrolase-like protein with peptidoglycan-binding domain